MSQGIGYAVSGLENEYRWARGICSILMIGLMLVVLLGILMSEATANLPGKLVWLGVVILLGALLVWPAMQFFRIRSQIARYHHAM